MKHVFLLVSILGFIWLHVATCEIVIPLTKMEPKMGEIQLQRSATGEGILLPGGYNNGAYYVLVSLGSSKQQFYLQVDSGSSDLLVYYHNCTGACSNVTFTADTSTTFVPCQTTEYFECAYCGVNDAVNTCAFVDSYGSGSSVDGYVVQDTMAVGYFPDINIDFGVIIDANSPALENYPTTGIWGLAYPALSAWNGTTAFAHLVAQTGIANTFSMCLVNNEGVMSMGIDYSTNPSFAWVDLINETFYQIDPPTDVSVNGESLDLIDTDYGLTIVDSGTTFLGLATNVYDAFKSSVQAICSTTTLIGGCPSDDTAGDSLWEGYCWSMSAAQMADYPTVTITLAGASADMTITFEPSDYLVAPTYLNGEVCLGVFDSGDGLTILGDVYMAKSHVVFDRVNSRLGFGDLTTCPTADTGASSHNSAVTLAIAYLLALFCLVMAI